MASLNDVDALIIDLRDNGGGFGETALLIAGYLFDRPAFLFDPRPNSPVPARTASPVSGNKLADKPVYVLTSSSTQSAAEYFAYNLKMLKRVTIVGETTAGRQHSGRFHRLTEHFGMGIQEVAPPDNPYPVKGWEVIGVEPDVKVPRTEALETAKRLVAYSSSLRLSSPLTSISRRRGSIPARAGRRGTCTGDALNARVHPVRFEIERFARPCIGSARERADFDQVVHRDFRFRAVFIDHDFPPGRRA